MSPGKLAAQVSHASMAFLTNQIKENAKRSWYASLRWNDEGLPKDIYRYDVKLSFDEELFKNWINGSFTKVVCEAKNKNKLMKVVEIAAALGLKENEDYFIIRDNCLTELEPEEVDENGVGRTVTCIGFAPLPAATANQISKKFQLYK
jgi:PTH2 family peptidyl-tRNA hydrolase